MNMLYSLNRHLIGAAPISRRYHLAAWISLSNYLKMYFCICVKMVLYTLYIYNKLFVCTEVGPKQRKLCVLNIH